MQHDDNRRSGVTHRFQFRLRTLLYLVSAVGVLLASFQVLGPEYAVRALGSVFLLFSFGLLVFAVWLAARNTRWHLRRLLVCHLAVGAFLLVGPILAYHVNGRAWYDYGLAGWNPPVSHDDGRTWIGDYDSKYTPPAVWPIVGPVLYLMSAYSIGLAFIPPTAEVITIALLVMAARLRRALTVRQQVYVWTIWTVGAVPVLYMVVWGAKVLEWIVD